MRPMDVKVGDHVRHAWKNGKSFGTGIVLAVNNRSKPPTAKIRWDKHTVVRSTLNPPTQSDVFLHTLTVIP